MSHVKTDKLSARTASGTITLGESGETLTVPSGVVLTNNGTASGFGLFTSYAIVGQLSTSTESISSGAWRTRALNTEISDEDNIVTLSADQITLGAGNYYISFMAPCYRCSGAIARFYNVTDAVQEGIGNEAFAYNAGSPYSMDSSIGSCRVSIAGSKVFELQMMVEVTYGSAGGRNLLNSGGDELYSLVQILKEA